MEAIQERWREICSEYLKLFCDKHGYDFETNVWVGTDLSNIGDIVVVDDMHIDMADVRYDIDNNVPKEKFEQWYWKRLELSECGVKNYLNYPSFCKGAPDRWTEYRMLELRDAYTKVQKAKARLIELCNEE